MRERESEEALRALKDSIKREENKERERKEERVRERKREEELEEERGKKQLEELEVERVHKERDKELQHHSDRQHCSLSTSRISGVQRY